MNNCALLVQEPLPDFPEHLPGVDVLLPDQWKEAGRYSGTVFAMSESAVQSAYDTGCKAVRLVQDIQPSLDAVKSDNPEVNVAVSMMNHSDLTDPPNKKKPAPEEPAQGKAEAATNIAGTNMIDFTTEKKENQSEKKENQPEIYTKIPDTFIESNYKSAKKPGRSPDTSRTLKVSPQLYDELKRRVNILEEFSRLGYTLDKLRKGSNGEYTCCCPFHDDKEPSFSVNEEKGVYNCFTCGKSGNIVTLWMETRGLADSSAAALDMASVYGIDTDSHSRKISDVKPPTRPAVPPPKFPPAVSMAEAEAAVQTVSVYRDRPYEKLYPYPGAFVKIRFGKDKTPPFGWIHRDETGTWLTGGKGAPLYECGTPEGILCFIVEGEKDADNLYALYGTFVVSKPNGAASKWESEYTARLSALGIRCAVVFQDNDKPGAKSATSTAKALAAAGIAVKVPDLSKIWEEMPEKSDISDYIGYQRQQGVEDNEIRAVLNRLIDVTPETEPQQPKQKRAVKHGPAAVLSDRNPLLAELRRLDVSNNPQYPWDNLGAGNLFADIFKSIARYCPDFKKWVCYDGTVWQRDSLKAHELMKSLTFGLNAYAQEINDNFFTEFVNGFGSRHFRENVLKDAQSVYSVRAYEFDSDGDLLNLQNGTINLQTFEFREHRSDDLFMRCAPVTYNPKATCPLWESTVTDILPDQEELLYLQKLAGLSLTTDTSRNKFDIFLGVTSRNGKSTVCDGLIAVLGNANAQIPGYAVSLHPDSLMERKFVNPSAPSPDMMQLMGARLCVVPEPKKGSVLDTEQIKRLTGDNFISARRLHEDTVNFRFSGNLIFDSNYMPRVTDATLFKSGRCVIVPFSRFLEEAERDEHRREKLTTPESLSGILNWELEGLRLMRETGMDIPAVCREETEAIWEDSDPVKKFFQNTFVPRKGGLVKRSDALKRYELWCTTEGLEPWTPKAFVTALQVYAGELGRGYVNGKRERGFVDYVLS